jgi:hypothetical protein
MPLLGALLRLPHPKLKAGEVFLAGLEWFKTF